MFSREVQVLSSVLCSSGGALQPPRLYRKLLQRCDTTEEDFVYIIQRCPRFLLVPGPQGASGELLQDCTVLARTSLRLCGAYSRGSCTGAAEGPEGSGSCQHLHLCKFFVLGTCRFGKGRKLCKSSHDIRSDHNFGLLRDLTLHELQEDDLFRLLLQNDPTLLPQVCLHYNKGSGPHGGCSFQTDCTKLHMCQHFLQGTCVFGLRCNRLHTFDQHGRRLLELRGLSGDIIQELPDIYRNAHHLNAAANANTSTDWRPAQGGPRRSPSEGRDWLQPPPLTDERQMMELHGAPWNKDKNDNICLHNLRNSCRFHNECRRVHFSLPYKWEVFDGITWMDLKHMEDIERDFCDPSNTQSGGNPPIDFQTMTQDSFLVRRLSTVSSVTKPPHYNLTTQWLWYYKGDQGNWVEYGEPDEKQRSMSVTSRTLEEAFLSDRSAEVKVVKGQRQYVVSFKDMYQRNPRHNTKRRVRRRPRFVSVAEVEEQVVQ